MKGQGSWEQKSQHYSVCAGVLPGVYAEIPNNRSVSSRYLMITTVIDMVTINIHLLGLCMRNKHDRKWLHWCYPSYLYLYPLPRFLRYWSQTNFILFILCPNAELVRSIWDDAPVLFFFFFRPKELHSVLKSKSFCSVTLHQRAMIGHLRTQHNQQFSCFSSILSCPIGSNAFLVE